VLVAACGSAWSPLSAGATADAAQESERRAWAAWLDARAAGFSGVVLIGRKDDVLVTRASGDADRASGRKITEASRFNVGSINKTFTAIAIAQLIQHGRLSLDDTLAKHVPDYPNAAAAARITIRDLISHRSGVPVFMMASFGDATVAEMTTTVGAQPQSFEPGARQEYSNGGYVVLGRVVEAVSGQNYNTYIGERIYKPAGMTTAGFVRADQRDGDIAFGQFASDGSGRPVMGGTVMQARPPAPGNPAGGGYASATDLFRFARALRTGRLLDARMTDLVLNGTFALAPPATFGFALREQLVDGQRWIGNGGGAPGVNAEFRFDPAGEDTVVVLSNTSPPAATQMLTDILNRLKAGSASATPPTQTTASSRQTADSALRKEVDALNASMVAAFKRDPVSVATFYTDDALIVGGGQRAEGGAAVTSYWKGAAMFTDWSLETLEVGGAADAPWQYGRSVVIGSGGRRMETFFLGLLRRLPSGALRFQVDAYSRERTPIGPTDAARISEAWQQASRGDAAVLRRIREDPFSLLVR
jgi:CubicO group peptidase (beta-lactamase class C family)